MHARFPLVVTDYVCCASVMLRTNPDESKLKCCLHLPVGRGPVMVS
jgi:hypothetical protein